MAEAKVPYVLAYGNITKALDGIKKASTPERFTQDFLATKLAMKGGGARPVIPFLKRIGFLNTDGSPTKLYHRFRNPASASAAAAEAMKIGFKPLYEVNEYAHDLNDKDLKGAVVQVTGLEESSKVVQCVVGSFKALRVYADFEASGDESSNADEEEGLSDRRDERKQPPAGINLGYTINLQLPPTSDIAVFNAIFKSLREHLLAQ